jgi:alanyl-tRNA synthetase
LFGEKYGASVRVVNVPGFSKELCGGTHTSATGTIGLFKIIHEGGIASGVRRIEAVSGPAAFAKIQEEFENLAALRALLKAQPGEESERLKKLLEKTRSLEKEITQLKEKLVGNKGAPSDDIVKIGDVSLLVKQFDGMDAQTLRTFIDNAKNQIKSGVIVVGSKLDDKVLLAAGVTQDLTGRYHAGNILKEIAAIVGGNGGGRPDMAQAGGTQPENLEAALQKVQSLIEGK